MLKVPCAARGAEQAVELSALPGRPAEPRAHASSRSRCAGTSRVRVLCVVVLWRRVRPLEKTQLNYYTSNPALARRSAPAPSHVAPRPRPSCSREPAPTTPRQLPPTPTVWPGTHSFPGLREAPSSHASSAAPAAAARRRRPEGGGGCGGQEAAARCAATAVAAAVAVAATAAATVVAAAMASAAVRRWWQR